MNITRRLTTLAAGTVLATATLVGVGASPASAGCGITLEVENQTNNDVRIDWDDSDVKAGGWTWKRLGSGSTWIDAGDTAYWNFTADFGCGQFREYRLDVNQGGSSWFIPYSAGWGWSTQDTTPTFFVT